MSPVSMCEPESPGSLSGDDSHSNNAGSEPDVEGQRTGRRGLKRRQKNRDAARKSRKKQTERADELHEELQGLERSNSELQKEIATLKKEIHLYETTLKRHEPHCHLKTSPESSDSFARPSFSDAAAAAFPGILPQSSSSLPTSKTSSMGSKSLTYIGNTHLLAPATTPGVSSVGPPPNLIASCSSSLTVPSSAQLSSHAAPRSSFEVRLPVASTPSSFLASVSVSPSEIAQLRPGQRNAAKTFITEPFLPKEDSSPTAAPPFYQGWPANASQLHPFQSAGNPSSSDLLSSLYVSPLPSSALPSFPVLPHSSLEPHPAETFGLKSRYAPQVTQSPAPQLPQLTAPSPFDVAPPTSSSFGELLAPPLQPHPPPGDPAKDLSLSELLEINDWILTGTNNQ
ncbi:unnamed protein product [Ophioblennius macclurei]